MIPVLETVKHSRSDTITVDIIATAGPHMKPPKVIIISFGSYFKNNTIGILHTSITTYANADKAAITVIFFVLEFISIDLLEICPKVSRSNGSLRAVYFFISRFTLPISSSA